MREPHRIGRVLRALREQHGISAMQASLEIGRSRGLVGMWEREERALTVEELVRLCRLYHVDPGFALVLMQASAA